MSSPHSTRMFGCFAGACTIAGPLEANTRFSAKSVSRISLTVRPPLTPRRPSLRRRPSPCLWTTYPRWPHGGHRVRCLVERIAGPALMTKVDPRAAPHGEESSRVDVNGPSAFGRTSGQGTHWPDPLAPRGLFVDADVSGRCA